MADPYRGDIDRTAGAQKPDAATTPQIFGGTAPEPSDDGRGVSDLELQSILRQELEDARQYLDEELSPDRAEATRYYQGKPFGNEEPGRSQVVSMDVRDAVQQIMPSLMRVFVGSERVVEFCPRGPGDEELAAERTDVCNYVFMEDNPGFRLLYAAFKDALIRKAGILKWSWDSRKEVVTETYEGLTQEQLLVLADDDDIENMSVEEMDDPVSIPPDEDALSMADPAQPPPAPQTVKVFKVRARRVSKIEKVRIDVIPPEEFLIDRRARSIEDATIVAHRRYVTRSDLVAMGYEEKFIDDHSGTSFQFEMNPEFRERQPNATIRGTDDANPALAKTLYVETYLPVDRDGDGIAELKQICTLGDDYFIARVEDADERPFADLCPDPEPHVFYGLSIHDLLRDMQLIKSKVLRSTLDSLSLAIHPRFAAVDGQVSLADLLSTDISNVVRERQPNMVRVLDTPFVGREGLGMMAFLDTIIESRVGRSAAANGLDADALQSATRAAVAATISAAQARVELLARIMAEGIRRVFLGIQRLLMQHQDIERTIRLRGKWVSVDPRKWDAPMDVVVNVGLGTGSNDERIAKLAGIAEKQEAQLQLLGVTGPMVGAHEYRNTLAKMAEAAGFPDASVFFKRVPPNWQPPEQAPKPTPEEILAQAQAQQIQAQMAIEAARLEFDRQRMLFDVETERMKIAVDAKTKLLIAEAQYQLDINEGAVDAEIRRMEVEVDAHVRQHEAGVNALAQVAAAPTSPGESV